MVHEFKQLGLWAAFAIGAALTAHTLPIVSMSLLGISSCNFSSDGCSTPCYDEFCFIALVVASARILKTSLLDIALLVGYHYANERFCLLQGCRSIIAIFVVVIILIFFVGSTIRIFLLLRGDKKLSKAFTATLPLHFSSFLSATSLLHMFLLWWSSWTVAMYRFGTAVIIILR